MSDDERFDPADELRRDIESAIEGQQPKEPEPEATESGPSPAPEDAAAEPAGDPGDRERDEKGRFVAKTEPEEKEEAAKPAEKAEDAKIEPAATEAAKTAVRPPPGFSVASKAAWEDLPQSVRDDIAKREQEVDAGFKRYAGLGKFAEEAERNGTTLQAAVSDYNAVEASLRQNFVGGIEFICQRMGVNPRQLAQVMTQRYGAPAQQQQMEGQPETAPAPQQAPAPVVDARAIAEHVTNLIRAEAAQKDALSQVASFGANPKNKFFDNVRPDMAKIVQAGLAETIEQAYDAACWNNHEIRTMLINEANGGRNREAAAAANKSRAAAKAVGGAPAPGVNPDVSGKRKNLSLDEEIRAAVDAQSGAA